MNEVGTNTQAGYLYTGTGTGTFAEVGRVPGGSETVILFNDWNDDGFLDYFASGHTWDAMWVTGDDQGRSAVVYFNENTSNPNSAPAAPAGLDQQVVDKSVTLSWTAPADDMTPSEALSYEVFVKDAEGNYLIAPASFVGGDNDGLRKLLQMGNANLNKSLAMYNLADGDYTWGVQAIDASYAGSTFATGAFSVGVPSSTGKIPSEALAKIYSQNNTLYVNLKTASEGRVTVMNMVGQALDSRSIRGDYSLSLGTGVYIVKVMVGTQQEVRKIVVE